MTTLFKNHLGFFISGILILIGVIVSVIYLVTKHHPKCKRGYKYSPSKNQCIPICPKTTPYYDSKRQCVQCRNSKDCSGETPVCDGTQCVACTLGDIDYCTSLGKVCDISQTPPKCVQCLKSSDCKDPTPVCDGTQCVTCTSGDIGYCKSLHKVCDTDQTPHKCVTCVKSSDCSDPTPVCNKTKCVACTSGNTDYCTSLGKVCDTSQTPPECVQCTKNSDCKDPTPVCNEKTCGSCASGFTYIEALKKCKKDCQPGWVRLENIMNQASCEKIGHAWYQDGTDGTCLGAENEKMWECVMTCSSGTVCTTGNQFEYK